MLDVCLLLEGTYPYVAGGVSTWVHQLITAMKDIRFGIVSIAPFPDPTRTVKYNMPENIIYFKEIYLHHYQLKKSRARTPTARDLETIRQFYLGILRGEYDHFAEFIKLFRGPRACLDTRYVFSSKTVWRLLIYFYERAGLDVSLLDYFWTWRATHLPLMSILKSDIPPAKIYHAVSTGYAGLLGAIAKVLRQAHFFLTEHGIYTHERMLEISQAHWIYEREKRHYRAERELSFFKQWWITMFRVMSHLTYRHADRIFTLYEGNKLRQVLEGARAENISIIPNGIKLDKFLSIKKERKHGPQIALIGRVVPIKDVKTFIYAAKQVLSDLPDAQFYVIGPTDEGPDYFNECKLLVENLKLEEKIEFTGRVPVKNYLKFLDLVVLTSISEAQPYAILEANVCGIPVVATNVGACREMLIGRTKADQNIGPSGIITDVAHPEDTARAITQLLTDKEKYAQYADNGRKRVARYYDLDDLLSKYLNVYEQNLS